MKPQLFSWMNPKLKVKKTTKYNNGVFASRQCKKGEVLAIFGGYVMTIKEEEVLPEDVKDLSLQISDDFVIGPSKKEEIGPADFFNHSCEPNAGFDGQIFLVAMRKILPEEEITFDYAMTVGGKIPYSFECLCETKRCRKTITNCDWKKPELQKKYKGYFQLYLNKKII